MPNDLLLGAAKSRQAEYGVQNGQSVRRDVAFGATGQGGGRNGHAAGYSGYSHIERYRSQRL